MSNRARRLPTPWDKAEYETHSRDTQARRRALLAKKVPEAEVDALFREQLAWDSKFLSSMKYSGKVGAFEGAGYEAKGLYRPEADCIMFTRDPGRLLPRVPARDRTDHRSVRAAVIRHVRKDVPYRALRYTAVTLNVLTRSGYR